MQESAIELIGLHKSFDLHHQRVVSLKQAVVSALHRRTVEHREVLRGIDLVVPTGQTLGIVGRNGSGKSTLLSLIAGVYKPTAGTVRVNGTVAPLLELGAGFHPDLTGIENIELYACILGMSRAEIARRMDEIVEFAFDAPDLREKIDIALRNYSDGMKMRLGFSIAVHTNPAVLLVDEVMAVGDEAFQQKCYSRIAQLQAEGRTIVFVSHDIRVVRRVAGRLVWLRDGLVHRDGEPGAVLDEYLEASRR